MEFQYHSGGDTNTRTQFPFLFKTIFLLISSSLRLLRVPPVLSIHLISLTVLNILIWYLLIASYTSALILTSLSSLPASLVYCYFNSSLSMLVSLSGCIPESCCSWSTSPIGVHNPPCPPPLVPCLNRRSSGCKMSAKQTGCFLSTQLLYWKKSALRASNKLG